VDVIAAGKKRRITIDQPAGAVFNKWLTDAKVPLPKGPAEK
jgi:hypothetical protein